MDKMKSRKILIAISLIAALVISLLPSAAMAAGELDVYAWADPASLNEGKTAKIYIEITNNTGKQVTLSAYGVDNEFYQIGEGTILDNGESTTITHVYFVSFGPNDSVGIPVQVNHEGDGGMDVLSFANQVELTRAQDITTVDFSFTPDVGVVESGGWVNFTIECLNTGNVDYTDFTVTANGADIEMFGLAVGESRTVIFSESYFDNTLQSFGYYFSYMSGGAVLSVVMDPYASMNVTVSAGETATQQPVDDASQSKPPQQEPQTESASEQQDNPSGDVAQPVLISEQDEDEGAAQEAPVPKSSGLSTLAVILIAVGAALLCAGVVITIVFSLRKKAKRSSAL